MFGGIRSLIRLSGSKPYRAGSYRLTEQSPGLLGYALHAAVDATAVCIVLNLFSHEMVCQGLC